MAKRVNPTLIGAFVLGAVALTVAAVIVFGTGNFLKKKCTYVLFFDGSVKGLDVGAPVTLSGVKIGEVTEVMLFINPDDMRVIVPVIITIDRCKLLGTERIKAALNKSLRDKVGEDIMGYMVEKGLRAQLQLQSIVTGKLLVEMNFHPDTPVRYVGLVSEHREIPTIPTTLETLAKKIDSLHLEKLVKSIVSAADGIDRIVNSPDLTESITALKETIVMTGKLVQHIDSRSESLFRNLNSASSSAANLMGNLDREMEPIIQEIRKGAEDMQDAMEEIKGMAEDLRGDLGEKAELRYRLLEALKEISAAARSIRLLAETLEERPDVLLRGRPEGGGE